MRRWLLSIEILNPGLLFASYTVAAIFLFALLLRFGSTSLPQRRLFRAGIFAGIGVILALAVLCTVVFLNLVGGALTADTWLWTILLFASLGLAVSCFVKTRLWKKFIAIIAIPIFVFSATLAINASYGLNRTVASLLGSVVEQQIELAPPPITPVESPATPLWQSWQPPQELPARGKVGTKLIDPLVSGFLARPAGVYLPPAALVPDAPGLPFMVLMMGQPGSPDPSNVAAILDDFASKNGGLAPIVVVVDQIGLAQADNLCLNTPKFGNVEDYVSIDVPNWAKKNLNILQDRKYWTIAGYSNGGQCAISMGAKHSEIWGNVLDISGEEFPGAEAAAENLTSIFAGDQAAYDKEKPVNILAQNRFVDTTAVFTVGSDDTSFRPGAQRLADAAGRSGMTVTYAEIPNGGHLVAALNGGLSKGFATLYPRWGLTAPTA